MPFKTLAYALVGSAILLGAAVADPEPPATENFTDMKARHLARLKEELACVEAATTMEAMRACRPQPPGGRGPGGHGGPPPDTH